MADVTNGFASTLVPVKGEALERGDYVYEPIRFGQGPEHVKYNKYRVLEVERGCARVVDPDGKERPKKIRFESLRIERTGSDSGPQPPLSSVAKDDSYQAWLDMGLSLVDDIAEEQRSLAEEKAKILKDVESIDLTHKKRIEALEDELARARRQHSEDRALVLTRFDAVNGKLEHANQRRKALESMLKSGR